MIHQFDRLIWLFAWMPWPSGYQWWQFHSWLYSIICITTMCPNWEAPRPASSQLIDLIWDNDSATVRGGRPWEVCLGDVVPGRPHMIVSGKRCCPRTQDPTTRFCVSHRRFNVAAPRVSAHHNSNVLPIWKCCNLKTNEIPCMSRPHLGLSGRLAQNSSCLHKTAGLCNLGTNVQQFLRKHGCSSETKAPFLLSISAM